MNGPQSASLASPDALPPPASPAGSGAAQRCRTAAERPYGRFNTIASPLQAQWSDIVTAVQASAPVTAMQPSFSACLVARGVPASLADRTDRGADNGLFDGFFSWADTLLQEATSGSQSVADEHRAAQVFVACAGPTVAVMERLQQAQRTTFLARHAGPVSQIEALAEAIPGPGR